MNSAALDLALIASPVTPLSPAQVGGAQAVVADLAQGLATRGHRVTLCCAAGSEVPGVELVQVEVPEEAARSALVQPGGPASPRVASVDAAITTMFETIARRGCDVIGQHAFDAVAFEVSPDRPVLHTLHLPPLVPAVVEAAGRLDSNLLISVSEASRVDWAGAGIQVGRVIRNGISSQPATGEAVRRQALAAGRLSPEKGFEDAIRACRLAGIPLVVAGNRYGPGYHLDLNGAEYLGTLTRPALRRLMAETAVFVCPIHWEEPFGLAAAEAQMAGCPVAGYRRGALPEVVEDGVSGILVAPEDVQALAGAISDCVHLDRAVVRASAIARLGIDAMLDAYEMAYTEVVR